MSGDVYVFFNRSRQTVKMLVWDRDGFVVYSKRLEGAAMNSSAAL
ncbi:MAG: IS66 family insertion sequence element accessory protein TnpB [Saprospiraceae bacterium]|nr:IS66 family insertion sequence element accessory protein TnpB [Saprospiraceae bacterium]